MHGHYASHACGPPWARRRGHFGPPPWAGGPPPWAGREGRPNREEWLSSLEEYQKDLEQQVADVADLIRRLKEEPDEPEAASA